MNFRLTLAIALLIAATPVWAGSACRGLAVSGAWIAEAPPVATVLAGYAVLVNNGNRPLRIDGAGSKDFGAVQIHEMSMDGGVMRMRELKQIEVPAHGRIELAPGGTHLMLLEPKRALKAGDSAALTLRCGGARREAKFTVKAAP